MLMCSYEEQQLTKNFFNANSTLDLEPISVGIGVRRVRRMTRFSVKQRNEILWYRKNTYIHTNRHRHAIEFRGFSTLTKHIQLESALRTTQHAVCRRTNEFSPLVRNIRMCVYMCVCSDVHTLYIDLNIYRKTNSSTLQSVHH